MAITIIVEDGSNVPDANSYDSVAGIRTYLTNRGITLPGSDDEVAAMMIKGMDYIEAKACEFMGKITYPTQVLQWPRKCVEIDCQPFPENDIPKQLKGALAQLVIALNAGVDIMPNVSATDYILEDTVGPITTKYSDLSQVGTGALQPTLPAVTALLTVLYGCCDGSKTLRTVRA